MPVRVKAVNIAPAMDKSQVSGYTRKEIRSILLPLELKEFVMDNRTNMLLFIGLVVLFAFTFIFGLDALSLGSVKYGVIALIGFLVCIGFSLFQRSLLTKEGGAMMPWFYSFTIVIGVVFVWYLTRCGTAFGWW